jgi:hypothetical protein
MSEPIKLFAIAETSMELETGLKYVRHLPEMTGMLFKFQSPKVLSFWMAETYLPLDIAFVDHEGMVVKTERMIPLSLRSVTSGRPCVMAIEAMPGTFARAGCEVGRKIKVDVENKAVTFCAD